MATEVYVGYHTGLWFTNKWWMISYTESKEITHISGTAQSGYTSVLSGRTVVLCDTEAERTSYIIDNELTLAEDYMLMSIAPGMEEVQQEYSTKDTQ